jgi:hypothetical protein
MEDQTDVEVPLGLERVSLSMEHHEGQSYP